MGRKGLLGGDTETPCLLPWVGGTEGTGVAQAAVSVSWVVGGGDS